MKRSNIFPSLLITPPFGGVLVGAILLLVSFVLVGEGIIQIGMGGRLWPEPLLGTINAELDLKIQTLDALVKKEPVDCIFLGSSQTDTAINPTIFSTEYQQLTGKKINCYNFSLGTLTAGPAGQITRILVQRYHPKYLIWGISARDFSRDFGELSRPFKDDPWIKYSSGEPNAAGWLLENSMFFRLASQSRAFLNQDYLDFRKGLLRIVQPDGFLYRIGNDLSTASASSIPKFKLYGQDLDGLDEVLSMDGKGVKILVLEIPVYNKFLENYVENNPRKYYSLFRDPISDRISETKTPFIHSQEIASTLIPDSGWNDILHLNYQGAEIFNKWLAGEIAPYFNTDEPVNNVSVPVDGNN